MLLVVKTKKGCGVKVKAIRGVLYPIDLGKVLHMGVSIILILMAGSQFTE